KSSSKSVAVVASPALGGQSLQFLHVAASEHYLVGFESGNQAGDHICDVAAPLLFPLLQQRAVSHIALVSSLFVGQVTQFHGLDDTVDDHGRSQAGSESDEQHFSAAIAAKRLHRRVIRNLYGTTKCRSEVETDPALSEVRWFRNRSIAQNGTWEANRHNIVAPAGSEPLHSRDHLARSQLRTGIKFARLGLTGHENLHMRAAYIYDQNVHGAPFDLVTAHSALDPGVPSESSDLGFH